MNRSKQYQTSSSIFNIKLKLGLLEFLKKMVESLFPLFPWTRDPTDRKAWKERDVYKQLERKWLKHPPTPLSFKSSRTRSNYFDSRTFLSGGILVICVESRSLFTFLFETLPDLFLRLLATESDDESIERN